jgi:endonuclease/exonuclease/phosphatase family metal-dependent hydrolase
MQPDVVCLQEIWQTDDEPNTGGWVAQHASGDWHWEFGGFGRPDAVAAGVDPSRRFGSAILSRWPIDAVEVMMLPVSAGAPGPPHVQVRPPALPAGMPFALLHVRTAGLDVYSTHLQPAAAQASHRVRQVLFVDDEIGRTYDPASSMPPILCGDFNAEPTSDEIRFLTSNAVIEGRSTYFQDAWAVLHDGGGFTWDPANHLAARSNEPRRRIDYVFVGDPSKHADGAGRVVGASLAFHEPRTGTLASDHYGVCVDVVWPTRPATSDQARS